MSRVIDDKTVAEAVHAAIIEYQNSHSVETGEYSKTADSCFQSVFISFNLPPTLWYPFYLAWEGRGGQGDNLIRWAKDVSTGKVKSYTTIISATVLFSELRGELAIVPSEGRERIATLLDQLEEKFKAQEKTV